MAITLGLLLIVLLSAGYAWLATRGKALIAREETERAQLTVEALTASLKNIMLAERGDTAHDWLRRVARLRNVESVNIYRVDGVEAFVDLNTIESVNKWLGEVRFNRVPGAKKTGACASPDSGSIQRNRPGKNRESQRPRWQSPDLSLSNQG